MERIFPIGGCFTPENNAGPVHLPTTDMVFSSLMAPSNIEVADPIALPNLGICDLPYQRDKVREIIFDQLGENETASIVGHSDGGLIGANIMSLHPDKISRTFAIASPFHGGIPNMQFLLYFAQYFQKIDPRGFDDSFEPFLNETLANYNRQLPLLARRLIMFAATGDDVVKLPSAWDKRYRGARRFEVPIWGIGSHFAITNYLRVTPKILEIHRTSSSSQPGQLAA